jgi:UDP-glucose 4-epimerase
MRVLLTGGAGYIGTHIAVELAAAGHDIVVVDSLVNSDRRAMERVEQLIGRAVVFYKLDVRDGKKLGRVFQENKIDAVIHLAGLKSVGESIEQPLEYYENNIDATFSLLNEMSKVGLRKLVFSSSATVYGNPKENPLSESSEVGVEIANPYGQTKYMIERILMDVAAADGAWDVCILRYFNPVGAHASGLIGEVPAGVPNNLMPYIAKVAAGELPDVKVFGDDYDTPDGTGVRDYIHVVDLARGHMAALDGERRGVSVYNLATGRGVSVLELIKAYGEAVGRDLPYEIAPRRAGDVAVCYASAEKAARELGWRADKTIDEACRDSWNFIQQLRS